MGREIAVREGIKALIVPSISGVGNAYRLAARIHDPVTGTDVKTITVKADGKDKVLDAVDELVERVRRDLGESLQAITQSSKPLVQATTSSLEALKQYSIATEKARDAKFDEAKLFCENALKIDPEFTAARASLGMLHAENPPFGKFDPAEGKSLLAEAAKNVEDLTHKEKYGILAFHAQMVEHDLEKAVNYHKTLLAMYPDLTSGHHNLGRTYMSMGRYEDAIDAFKAALRIDPYLMITYNNLSDIYLYRLGAVDSAIENCKRQIANNDQHQWAYNNLGWAYLGKDNLEQAEIAFKRVQELNPRLTFIFYRLGHVYRLQKRYDEALKMFQRILEIDRNDCWGSSYNAGVILGLMGKRQAARDHFDQSRKCMETRLRDDPKAVLNYMDLALALARLGEREKAQAMAQKGLAIHSTPSWYEGETLGVWENHFEAALFLSVQGKTDEALRRLELAIEQGFRNYIWMKIHPDLQNLYNHPGFISLIRRSLKASM